MKNLTLKKIAEVCGTVLVNEKDQISDIEASAVVIDSRKATDGAVFIATRGERVDGHDYIDMAMEAGALGVICEEIPKTPGVPYILVKDSFIALKQIAKYYRSCLDIKVVGITGSVGKTSTKEFVASVLSQKYSVCKTQGNFNNEVGLPLTVLSIREEHEIAVLEMGISDFGEMTRLSEIAKPDICVMTNIGQCHLENLGSREGILKAKSEIFTFMNPNGYAVLCGEDDYLNTIGEKGGHEPLRYGFDSSDTVYGDEIVHQGLLGSDVTIHMNGKAFRVNVPLPGIHMILNALAAVTVASIFDLDISEIQKGIASVPSVSGRSHIMHTRHYTLVDDCYNANPVSMKAAIDLLTTAKGRKVAILGDMKELGEDEARFHYEVGQYVAQKDIDVLICIGDLAKDMAAGATGSRGGMKGIYWFASKEEAEDAFEELLQSGDNILLKASHSMKFEEIISELLKDDIFK